MLSFESLWWALFPPALYFGIHLVEGETLTPMPLARRFTLNPVLVILSLVFWFWMWAGSGPRLCSTGPNGENSKMKTLLLLFLKPARTSR
jgi:hypothetical protein